MRAARRPSQRNSKAAPRDHAEDLVSALEPSGLEQGMGPEPVASRGDWPCSFTAFGGIFSVR
jgi:hypothetical protein